MLCATFEQRSILAPFIRNGRVDYDALSARLDLDALVTDIAREDVSAMGRDQQLAFYLNAYNLVTLHQVLERLRCDRNWAGPVSLLDKLRFFLLTRYPVAGRRMSLLELENHVIRRRFQEPRVHFALNCASSSCPYLPGSLFVAEELESDLERLTMQFLASDEVTYEPGTNTLTVSPIFKWYRKDFQPSIPAFIARYRDTPVDANLRFRDYDWRLNRER